MSTVSDTTHVLDGSGTRPYFHLWNTSDPPHPDQPHWTEVTVDFYCFSSGNKYSKTSDHLTKLRKHCTEFHPEARFSFLHKAPLDDMKGYEYSVKLHVQRALRRAAEQKGP